MSTLTVKVEVTPPGKPMEVREMPFTFDHNTGWARLNDGPESIDLSSLRVLEEFTGPDPRAWAANFGSDVHSRKRVPATEMIRCMRAWHLIP